MTVISRPEANTDLRERYPVKEVNMTNQEMRDVVKRLNVPLFKMNYKAGVRLPNLEAFLAGDDNAFAYDPKATERLSKMLEAEVKKSR
jgi:hypothetical protein